MQAAKAWVVQNVLRRRNYQPQTSVDRLVFGVVLNLEIPLLLGFCYPLLPVLACLVVSLNAGVLYITSTYLGLTISPESSAKISVRYLWGSLALGCTLIMWLFIECDWHGKWLVITCMPSCAVISHLYWRYRSTQHRSPAFSPSLTEHLLAAEDFEDMGMSGVPLETTNTQPEAHNA